MRIAICGAQNTGKSTLVKNFLAVWDMYSAPTKSYRDVIKEKNLPHSSSTTKETQWEVLNFMLDQIQASDKSSNIVFDRCPLDNLVYTMWAYEKGIEGFDKEFVDKCITLTRESLRSLDIIFLLRYDPSIVIEDDGLRDTSVEMIIEVDNIFNALQTQFKQNFEANVFFPANDSPALIELPTSIKGRIDLIGEFINTDGNLYSDEHSLFNPANLDELERLVKQQKAALDAETAEKELYKKFGLQK